MSILKRRDEEARKVNRVRKIWQAAKRDMRNNRRAARRGAPDRTLEIMSKYEPIMGDEATAGFFSGEKASGMVSKAEDHFRDMQRLREQKRMQNQKNIDLLGGGAEPGDDVFEPDPSFYTDEKQTNRGTPGDSSLRKPATASSNKADDINTPNEDGTTKGVYSPRKPYVDTVQRNALSRELDKIRRGADAYRRNFKNSRNPVPENVLGDPFGELVGSDTNFQTGELDPTNQGNVYGVPVWEMAGAFQAAGRMLETENKYGEKPVDSSRVYEVMRSKAKELNTSKWTEAQSKAAFDITERYARKLKADSHNKARVALGVDDNTLKAIEAISTPEIQNKLLNDLGIDREAWGAYTKSRKTA